MISKHIVVSMIVIGCLVQFITCPTTADNKNKPSPKGASNPSSSKPSSGVAQGNPPQGVKKPGASPAAKTGVQPRGLQQPNENPKNNGQVKDSKTPAKKPTGSKKPEASNQNIDNDSIPENEGFEEKKPKGRLRRAFKMFNGLRKKMCPIKLFGKVIKKTRKFGKNMLGTVMNKIKSKSRKQDDADDSSQNNA